MKRKAKKAIAKKRKMFRYRSIKVIDKSGRHLNIRHPAYIIIERGNIYVHVIITHSATLNNKKLIELRKNPNPLDSRKSYRQNELFEATIDKFSKRLNGWKMDPLDDKDIRTLIKK